MKSRARLAPVALALTMLGLPFMQVSSGAEPVRVGRLSYGFAQESITPDQPVAIAGQYETRISGVIHDPLTVTALAIETRDESGSIDHVIWVSCDMVGIRKQNVDNARKLVAAAVPDVNPNKIIVSATHTHTAPALTDTDETDLHPYDFAGSWAYRIPADQTNILRPSAFADFLEHRIASAVIKAWRDRRPGEISSALGHASVARNRRAVFYDGSTRMYGDTRDPLFSHTEGTSDDSVDILFLWRGEQLVGLVVTLYCPSQEVEGEAYLSADFWHDTRSLLREQYALDLFVLPLTGASGDQSPHVQVGRTAETMMHERRRIAYRQEIARRIVHAVDDAIDVSRAERTPDLQFDHEVQIVELPVWQVPEARFVEATTIVKQGENRINELTAPEYIRWRVERTMLARFALQQREPVYRTEIHAVRIGDVGFVTNPFELFTDYAMRIKARSPAKHTSVVQLTADCAGYLPTERAIQGGGYSARIDDGVVGPEGGRKYVDEAVQLLSRMWSGR